MLREVLKIDKKRKVKKKQCGWSEGTLGGENGGRETERGEALH